MNKGLIAGATAYFIWGLLPIYWKTIHLIRALEIIGHRIMWSFIFLAILLFFRKDWMAIRNAVQEKEILLPLIGAAGLLLINWLTYVWGVNAGFIVETSLGYFINPLINVVFGVFFFKERLRVFQWTAVVFAALGVFYLTISYGQLPWIALTLAFSFGLYGLLKKKARLGSTHGLTLETGILFLPAVGYLIWLTASNQGAFFQSNPVTIILLVLTGLATAIPLLLFANAAQNIDLSVLGLLQYIAPTMQFIIGVLIYGEPFDSNRLIGFSIIWVGLLIFSTEGVIFRQKNIKLFSKI